MGPNVGSVPGSTRQRIHGFRRQVVLFTALFAILLVIGVGLYWPGPSSSLRISETEPFANLRVVPSATEFGSAPSVFSESHRPVYPYSIVPGGVRTPQELELVAKHDRVVAEHYQGFDYRRARVIEVSQRKLVYVSYRKGSKVSWTKKKVALHKGERLITDGNITARTRCANQVSETAPQGTAENDPVANELEHQLTGTASAIETPFPGSFDSSLTPRPYGARGFLADPAAPIAPSPVLLAGGGMLGSSGPVLALPTCQADSGKKTSCKATAVPPDSNPPGSNPPGENPPKSVPEPSMVLWGA